jgi:phosphohistidine phosphatase SixA
MPLVFCLRHASYHHDGEKGISDQGIEEAHIAGEFLSQKVLEIEPKSVRVLVSPMKRAQDTAEIIAKKVGVVPETHALLTEYPRGNIGDLYKEVAEGKLEAEVIVLITHFYTVEGGPQAFAKLLSTDWQEISKPKPCEGWIINTDLKTLERIVI